MDFSQVIFGINDQIGGGLSPKTLRVETELTALTPTVEPYYIASVSMPALKVRADEVKRDSRPYMMPGYDEPLPEIKIMFVMESPVIRSTSKIYTFMDTWRAFVRAGRGALGNEKTVSLNKSFTVGFRFPVSIKLLRGNSSPKVYAVSQTLSTPGNTFIGHGAMLNQIATVPFNPATNKTAYDNRVSTITGAADVAVNAVENDLEVCGVFQLERAWLSSFKVTDLDYSKGNEITKIEATLYAENIRDLNQ
ncbi:MAG: hypothetical protein ACOYB3_00875 [Azonexus sp.]